jgi:hypothetical protein
MIMDGEKDRSHFRLVVSPNISQETLTTPALPAIGRGRHRLLLPLFTVALAIGLLAADSSCIPNPLVNITTQAVDNPTAPIAEPEKSDSWISHDGSYYSINIPNKWNRSATNPNSFTLESGSDLSAVVTLYPSLELSSTPLDQATQEARTTDPGHRTLKTIVGRSVYLVKGDTQIGNDSQGTSWSVTIQDHQDLKTGKYVFAQAVIAANSKVLEQDPNLPIEIIEGLNLNNRP